MGSLRRTLLVVGGSLALAGATAAPQADRSLDRVRSLARDSLAAPLTTFYSSGFQERAKSLQATFREAATFFRARVGVTLEFSVAVLDEEDWAAVGPRPYGAVWVSQTPAVVVMPARLERSQIVRRYLAAGERASPELRQAITARGGTLEQNAHLAADLVGYHEVGHVALRAMDLTPSQLHGQLWFNEMLATYAAYGFLRARYPDQARLWQMMVRLNVEGVRPGVRSLDEFNRRYEELPRDTYAWYQGSFLARVADVYETAGLEFLEQVRRAGFGTNKAYMSAGEFVQRLETIVPGFEDWRRTLESRD